MDELPPDLLTLAEVARLLEVKPARLRTWRHRGLGPKSFKVGPAVVYRLTDVKAWQAGQDEEVSA